MTRIVSIVVTALAAVLCGAWVFLLYMPNVLNGLGMWLYPVLFACGAGPALLFYRLGGSRRKRLPPLSATPKPSRIELFEA